MLPIRLEIRNFLAYRQPDPISFEGLHLVCLSGPNGAGKSSLLDAITWALWGRARVRGDDDLIYQGQTDMLVQLDFLHGTSHYRVVRKRQKGKTSRQPGRSTLDLFMWDDGRETWQRLTAPSIHETQKQIVDLLRLDYETFVNSAFLQQGHADTFTVKTPAQRKETLAAILGLERWKAYEEHAKEELKRIAHNRDVIAVKLDEIAQQEAREPTLRHELEVAEADLADAGQLLAEAEARYAEVAGAEEQMSAAQARLAQAEHRMRLHQRDLDEIDAELDRYQKQLDHLTALADEREAIEAGYARLQAAREADQQLGEKLQMMSGIKDRLSDVTASIQARRSELEAQASVHRDRIAKAEGTVANLDTLQADLANIQAEVERLEAQEARRDELREAIGALNTELAELKTTNKTLREEMNAIKARLNQLEQAGAACPLCGQPLDEAHKASLLAELQADGTARGDTYRRNEARQREITELIAQHRDDIAAIEAELNRLPAQRERAGSLSASLEAAQTAADVLHTERSGLRAIEALLDSGEYAQELETEREALQAEIERLGYDHEAHNAARETLTAYSDYERQQRELEAALRQIPETRAAIENMAARRARWVEALEAEQAAAAAAQAQIAALREQVEEARRREEEVRQRRTAEKRAHEQVIRAQQALAALEQARQRRAELEQRQLELGAEQSIYEDLRTAFGRNGIPAMIIEAAIPELEEAANALLARMTEGRMHVRLDTQRDLKSSDRVAETLDILISDELGTRSYELYSGGEAFRVNFAIRVALSQMLARRAGAQLRTLFIDEGFGTQDEMGRQRLVEAINAVQDQFDLLLVITHIDELREAFPVQIEVSKTSDGSRVSVN